MKRIFIIASVVGLMWSCGEKRVCMNGEQEIDCNYQDMYDQLSTIEAEINASFKDGAPEMSNEEKLKLRENWVSLYESKGDSIKQAFEMLGGTVGFPVVQMYKMRKGEIDHFKKQIEKDKFLVEFMPKLAIEESIFDTVMYDMPSKSLIWKITNNSDSTIKNFGIVKHFYEGENKIKSSNTVYYMFSKSQLSPKPADGEKNYLKPGSTLELSFGIDEKTMVKPEIKSVSF